MKQIQILFSTPMVQALRRAENPKTMTRRLRALDLVNKKPDNWLSPELYLNYKRELCAKFKKKGVNSDALSIKSPYGKAGDLLWVRETWAKIDECSDILYKANGDDPGSCGVWKPSIHMPKDACRIWLQITDIQVERLQHITEADAIREGVLPDFDTILETEPLCFDLAHYYTFKSLWIDLNGKENWDQNPWVWVVSFNILCTDRKPGEAIEELLERKEVVV